MILPERLGYPSMESLLMHIRRSGYKFIQLGIDEVHLALGWDAFREYNHTKRMKTSQDSPMKMTPTSTIPTLILTATITKSQLLSTCEFVGMAAPATFISDQLHRPNIKFAVEPPVRGKRQVAEYVKQLLSQHSLRDKCGIIYCGSRYDCIDLAQALEEEANLSVGIYYSKLPSMEKDASMDGWKEGSIKIMIATTAFGVGVNKKDVRFVIEAKLPMTMMDLIQESGRSGRDNQPAMSFLLRDSDFLKSADAIILKEYQKDEHQTDYYQAKLRAERTDLKFTLLYSMSKHICRRFWHELALRPEQWERAQPRLCLDSRFTDLYPDEDMIPCDICEENLTLKPWPAVHATQAIEDILSITGFLEDDEDRREGQVDITPDLVARIYGWSANVNLEELHPETVQRATNIYQPTARGRKMNAAHVKDAIDKMIFFGLLYFKKTSYV
ncbi:P-loop containing nucleoside triphosphate hydrolase protein [Phlyctochytrium arcticum]|nr:P-loop containing nucleoside triphosphate hydrolase protein [Phlyctochytrium arcticum]KAI9103372.1 P-loop containing nucleoside triphosphate hydrolase protein [Phlyctochytrium arcticum]